MDVSNQIEYFINMKTINLDTCDKYMLEAIKDAMKGESIYSQQDENAIRTIFKQEIPKGKDYSRIYEETLKKLYPLPSGEGLFASSQRLREIFSEEAKEFKESVKIDKEILWEQLAAQYKEMYWRAIDKKDDNSARKILDSMQKLLGAEKAQRVLDQMQDKDGNVEFKLDFNL